MRRVIVYLAVNSRHLDRLAVSLCSLRKHWFGDVLIVANRPEDVAKIAGRGRAQIGPISFHEGASKNQVYLLKSQLGSHLDWQGSDYVFLDADTTVHESPEFLFDVAEEKGVVLTRFSSWVTNGKIMSWRLRRWASVKDDDVVEAVKLGLLNPFPAINTGVFAVRANSWWWRRWADVTAKNPGFICDEIAAQLISIRWPESVAIVDERWNCSAKFGRSESPAIRHYHGASHGGNAVWMAEAKQAEMAGYL